MRVAGIDLGKVRVGLALSDELGMLAHPRPFLDGSNMATLLTALTQLSVDEGVERFIVGLPRLLDGREGPPARRARRFAEVLGTRSGKPVELVDEWLSTREASARLRDGGLDARQARSRIDSASAAVLLQAWLDRRTGR
jgi:putative holliday junction resolvase